MKVLIDTNIILDVCFERAEFQDYSTQIFSLIEQKNWQDVYQQVQLLIYTTWHENSSEIRKKHYGQ